MRRAKEGHLQLTGRLDQYSGWLKCSDIPYGLFNTGGVIGKRLVLLQWTNMNIQASLAGVDTDVDLIVDCVIHRLVFVCLAILARGFYALQMHMTIRVMR